MKRPGTMIPMAHDLKDLDALRAAVLEWDLLADTPKHSGNFSHILTQRAKVIAKVIAAARAVTQPSDEHRCAHGVWLSDHCYQCESL